MRRNRPVEGKGVAEPAVALHDKKNDLREQHRSLVGTVARKAGIDHRRLNAELIKRTGGRVDQATVAQLAAPHRATGEVAELWL